MQNLLVLQYFFSPKRGILKTYNQDELYYMMLWYYMSTNDQEDCREGGRGGGGCKTVILMTINEKFCFCFHF